MTTTKAAADLRRALGRFATGVAVVTVRGLDGRPVGLTINSFSSVSLDPPLVLWCLANRSPRLADFAAASHFAVNVLTDRQRWLSDRFSQPVKDRFESVAWAAGLGGAPLLDGCLAQLECTTGDIHRAGDHSVVFGKVERFAHRCGLPLVFFANGYGMPVADAAATAAII